MTIDVKFLSKDAMEKEANRLLGDFERSVAPVLCPPIPVEDILEKHLGYEFDLDDLCGRLEQQDVLGAIWVSERRVIIDQSLDPTEFPALFGRYRFTISHEIGHDRLHGSYLKPDPQFRQIGLLAEASALPSHVCRSSQAKLRIEHQADYFASCLLMPRQLLFREWEARRNSREPVHITQLRKHQGKIFTGELLRTGYLSMEKSDDDLLFEAYCRPLAEQFQVSPIAMRIRLENLGLLVRGEQLLSLPLGP